MKTALKTYFKSELLLLYLQCLETLASSSLKKNLPAPLVRFRAQRWAYRSIQYPKGRLRGLTPPPKKKNVRPVKTNNVYKQTFSFLGFYCALGTIKTSEYKLLFVICAISDRSVSLASSI